MISRKTEVCVVDGCDRADIQGHGMCQMHYYRWRRQGDPGAAARRKRESVGTCTVDGCGQPDVGPHGYCSLHRGRWLASGDPTIEPKIIVRPAECEIEGCSKPPKKKNRLCSMHIARVARHGDPSIRLPTGHPGGEGSPRWTGEAASYTAVHHRVRAAKGKASGYPCALCAGRQGQQWAYDHEDPDERASDLGPYSVVLDHYLPLCIPCHKRFDLGWIQERAA